MENNTSLEVYKENELLKPLSVLEQKVVSMYADGITIKDIAMELGLTSTNIRAILNKPKVKEVANDVILNTGLALKAEKLRLIEQIVNDKLKKAEEEGKSLADLVPHKDIVDLIKTMDDLTKEIEKKELGTDNQNVYIQLLNNIMD